MPRRLPVLFATLALATAAAADPAADYAAGYLGAYAATVTCAGEEFQLDLMETRVTLGETGCDIGAVGAVGGGLALSLVNCNAEGEPAEDRIVGLLLLDDGALSYSGDTDMILRRCTDR